MPHESSRMYDDVVFPTDGETGADTGFERAVRVAETFEASLHVLYVADTTRDTVTNVRGDVVDALEREGRSVVDEYVERAADRGVDAVDVVLQGQPHATIVQYADAETDLLVMPTSGREGVSQHLLGSTTERVVRTADVPVLTVPVE